MVATERKHVMNSVLIFRRNKSAQTMMSYRLSYQPTYTVVTVSSGKKGSLFETAAGKATTEQVAEVELWLEQQDERPALERLQTLWNATDDIGRAAMRAFVLDAA
jgi:hypothetical protein